MTLVLFTHLEAIKDCKERKDFSKKFPLEKNNDFSQFQICCCGEDGTHISYVTWAADMGALTLGPEWIPPRNLESRMPIKDPFH